MGYREGTADGAIIGAVIGVILLTFRFYSSDNSIIFVMLWTAVGAAVGAIRARKFHTVYDVRSGGICGFWIAVPLCILYVATNLLAAEVFITALIIVIFIQMIFAVAIGAAMGVIIGKVKGVRQTEAKVPIVLQIVFSIFFAIAVILAAAFAAATETPAGWLLAYVIIIAIVLIIMNLTIPFVWWLVAHRKKEKFFAFIGILKPRFGSSKRAAIMFAIAFIGIYTLFTVFQPDSLAEFNYENVYIFIGLGFAAVLPGLIYAYLGALCTEAFFQGFVLKRLKGRIGLWPAIIAQAVLAVLMFNALQILFGDSFHAAASFLIAVYGIMAAILNEKVFAGSSIIPSVILMGTINFVAAMWAAFAL